ncbi:MAG: pilus assembly protein TadG-related protein [Clostridia bacterium]|nr:pilus assembly protein TadG-related protein [Clostridia bacterium]
MGARLPRLIGKAKFLLRSETGALYGWIVLLLPVFLLLMGLVTDLAAMYTLAGRVQSTLDAAGTSAVSSSLLEESILDGSRAPEIDPDKARETFLRLVKSNLRLNNGLDPQGKSYLEGRLVIKRLDIKEKGPPTITVTVVVPFKTIIFRFLVKEVRLPVHSESILDMK